MQYETISDTIKNDNVKNIKNIIEQIVNDMNESNVENENNSVDNENLQIKITNTRSNDKLKKITDINIEKYKLNPNRYDCIKH